MKHRLSAPWGVPLALLLLALSGCGGAQDDSGRPGAPANAIAEAADAQAVVAWTPPKTDGGNSLLYYVVRCEPECPGAMVSADRQQVRVMGLVNGSPYVFRVFAVNEKGEGPPSVATRSVTPLAGATLANPTVPGQPRAVRATPGNGQVYVSWLAPATFGGRKLLGYRVTTEPGGVSVTVEDGAAVSTVIRGLENGQPYSVSVHAFNEVGDGPKASARTAAERWVSGYWVSYQRDRLHEDAVDFSGLTHLIVGRFNPRLDGLVVPSFEWQMPEPQARAIAKRLSERAHQAGRKALLMLGGDGGRETLAAASAPETRPIFVRSLLKTLEELGYDGVDVDWEPIDLAAGDGERLIALLEELRAARPGIILTVPVFPWNTNFGMPADQAAFALKLAARVDQLNIMSYGMSYTGGWDSWHSSALQDEASSRPMSVSSSVRMYLEAGVPAGRLGVGTGFYGMCWRGVTGPRVPLTEAMQLAGHDNVMSYANIMSLYFPLGVRHWDERASVPYLSFPSEKGPLGCDYVSYEDAASIQAKGQYVRQQGLGGTIIWTLNQGHRPTEPAENRHPLSRALKQAFLDP
ncbi:MAG TPA: glycosyl hydrolase family 18 protein [Myxococcus sp.]|nr:glycosyl hydrolase family 18 protein [Myxococcus sp.]